MILSAIQHHELSIVFYNRRIEGPCRFETIALGRNDGSAASSFPGPKGYADLCAGCGRNYRNQHEAQGTTSCTGQNIWHEIYSFLPRTYFLNLDFWNALL